MKDSTRVPEQKCSKCGYQIDSATEAYGDGKPRPGDISMCLGCGHATFFAEDLSRREPTPEEALKLSLTPEIMFAQLARARVVGDDLSKRNDRS